MGSTLSHQEILHLCESCVCVALVLLWAALTVLNGQQKAVRTALPSLLLFLVQLATALALFHGHAVDYARNAAAVVQSLFISLLLGALLKLYPMVAFGSTLLMAGSLLCYLFAVLLPSDDAYQTGVLVVGGTMALCSALLYLYAPGRRNVWYTLVFFLAVAYYAVVFAATLYGPMVLDRMSHWQHELMWSISTLLALCGITLMTRFLYVPAEFRAVISRKTGALDTDAATGNSSIDDRPLNAHAYSDIYDFFAYVIETGRYAPPLPHKE